ncbi:hypothetical protein [Oerskovia rustica]|uniref:Uncharacterized protein n=1 Tax=Oerskovia rustica TaxID=2762237 RepID=A0ABR8RTV4_9CELL|nr:hypothetical protein [Oerskovia rustica]MBD7951216.1 hypothetical protein [Oerskovia rustica]
MTATIAVLHRFQHHRGFQHHREFEHHREAQPAPSREDGHGPARGRQAMAVVEGTNVWATGLLVASKGRHGLLLEHETRGLDQVPPALDAP